MDTVFAVISFIPYFIYLYFLGKNELIEKEKHNLFRFDTLILVAIFVYFTTHDIAFVNEILFFTINLYLLVNKLYDKEIKKKINLKKHVLKFIFIYLLAIILLLPYILKQNLTLSYFLSFAFILAIHFIMVILKKICK